MSSDIRRLYPEVIKTHQSKPFNYSKKENAAILLTAYNPICGDKFDLYIDIDVDKITNIHFYGFGCAISKASSSLMTRFLIGKTRNDALTLCNDFLSFLNNEIKNNDVILPEELQAFSGVHDFPEREECASLSWKEMKNFLERFNQVTDK